LYCGSSHDSGDDTSNMVNSLTIDDIHAILINDDWLSYSSGLSIENYEYSDSNNAIYLSTLTDASI
jgi:hypothetical protein